MEKVVNTGIIGFGLSGKVFHAPFLHVHPGFNLSKVVERHSNAANERYPDATIVRNYKALLDDASIDLVAICTPNTDHFQMAKDSLDAGKHVIIEKPFMPTAGEADEIIEFARKKGLNVFVYQNRRWDGDFLTIQKLINGGLLGDIQYYEAHFDRYAPVRKRAAWRDEVLPGSGILFDLGSHLIDQALCLFGKPLSVVADIRSQREGSKVDDFFEVKLKYINHTAMVTAGMLVEDHDLRYLINGTDGTFTKYGIDPQETALKQDLWPGSVNWGEESPDNWGLINFQHSDLNFNGTIKTEAGNYMSFYNNVYDVITTDAEMAVKPKEARDVIKIIELAVQSNQEKAEIKFQ